MINLPRIHAEYEVELTKAINDVVQSGNYIGGPVIEEFQGNLSTFLDSPVCGVGNGTDALLIALMALGIGPGDEVIVPAFTYAASAEVIGLLGARAIWCDVDPQTFCATAETIQHRITPDTKAIIAVHLYGQCAPIEQIENIAGGIPIVEDTAQAFGAKFLSGKYAGRYAGTVGAFGTFSFFPTKSLGAMGDGGAIASSHSDLFEKASMIAKHGQSKKYVHTVIGVNSRLDPIQAAVLNVKLKYFEKSVARKQAIADNYFERLSGEKMLVLPYVSKDSSHVWHQFTVKIPEVRRDLLQEFLQHRGISSIIYYPMTLADQEAYKHFDQEAAIPNSRALSQTVLSIPIDESLSIDEQMVIIHSIKSFFIV